MAQYVIGSLAGLHVSLYILYAADPVVYACDQPAHGWVYAPYSGDTLGGTDPTAESRRRLILMPARV